MKNLTVFSIVLVFLMIIACTQEVETIVEKPKVLTTAIYSVHDIELNADVDTKEFETFLINNMAPIYNKMKGQKFYLVKGDRGIRTDKYAIVLTFESIEDRNRIYPPSGEYTEDFGDTSIWEKYNSMVTTPIGKIHTDYVLVKQ